MPHAPPVNQLSLVVGATRFLDAPKKMLAMHNASNNGDEENATA